MTEDLTGFIDAFFEAVGRGDVEIYNEFSLQHELGCFLRSSLAPDHKVQFERPVTFFGLRRADTLKKEIDISVIGSELRETVAIELKFPRSGQYPEQMFAACQDIGFLEDLVRGGFNRGYFVMAADDPLFFSGGGEGGLYGCFRAGLPIAGDLCKPTGARDKSVRLAGEYRIRWQQARLVRYACVTVSPATVGQVVGR